MTKSKTTQIQTPDRTPAADGPKLPKGKLGAMLALLQRPEGATVEAMQDATGWQKHSIRGAMSGAIKKKLGFEVISEKTEAGRVYSIAEGAGA